METHTQFDKVRRFWANLDYVPLHIVEAQGHSGGLWCLVPKQCGFGYSVYDVFGQAITVEIKAAQASWMCTGVYANPIPAARLLCWYYLKQLRRRIPHAWTLVGDFNDSLLGSNQRGGVFSQARADLFASVLQDCNLLDIHTIGNKFTWVRKRAGLPIMHKKLDWCLGDQNWRVSFPEAVAENLVRLHSDHTPVLVRCGGFPGIRGVRPFRFEAAWISHSDYEQVVSEAWELGTSLATKLQSMQEHSLIFNKDVFGHIMHRKRHLEAHILGLQRKLEVVDSASLAILQNQLQQELDQTLAQEEILWFQKSREQQALYGDRNTKYFHTQTLNRSRRNKIHALTLPNGEKCTDDQIF